MRPVSRILYQLCALLLVASLQLSAQETKVVRDLMLWTGAAVEKSLGKDWTLSLGEEIRFKHNISEINNYFTEAGLRYRINKQFALEGGYRFTRDRKSDGSYETRTRYNLDLRFRQPLDFMTIDYRLRYQKEVDGFGLLGQGSDYEKYVRHRVKLRYDDLKRIEPFVSGEVFQRFLFAQSGTFHFFRIVTGVKVEPGNWGSFVIAYGFNREITSLQPAMIYQLQMNYTYEF